MGLRELKAHRTRAALHDSVLTLAEENGYEAVTIEQIADRAEVGISTLYRYFPSKDAILLDPIAAAVDDLADAFRSRPDDEPLDLSLGHAAEAYLAGVGDDAAHLARLRIQLDRAPGPRARLWDLVAQQRSLLVAAIAEREGVEPDDLGVVLAAQLTVMVVHLALDRQRDTAGEVSLPALATSILDTMRSRGTGLMPRLPAASADED